MEGWHLGRVRGVDLRLNWSVLIIATLVAWSLADAVFPEYAEGYSEQTYWVVAALTAAAFFAALAAHELGHATMATREGVEVKGITLWLFGGIAELGSQPETPRAALRIAAAGPAVSAALGLAGVALGLALDGLAQVAVLWFGLMNIMLVLFNLLPAFPLDGGRIYQAMQWRRTGDATAATRRAVTLGLTIGAVLVGLGVLQVLIGSLIGGLWLMLIGWFIREAARAEWRHAALEEPLSHLLVNQVMSPDPITVRADIGVNDFIAGVFFGGRHAAYPVTDDAGRVIGLITLSAVRRLTPEQAETHTVGELVTPVDRLPVVDPWTPVATLLQKMEGEGRALVFDDDRLVGIVSPSDIARLISVIELASPLRSTDSPEVSSA